MTRPTADELRRLYVDEQQSLARIAEPLGVSKALVGKWLQAAGIPRRSVSEATALAQTGRQLSDKHRAAMIRNAAKARAGITEESRRKQSATRKRQKMTPWNKGKPMGEEQRQKLIAQRADPEYRRQQSERQSGEKHHNWRGGTEKYHAGFRDNMEWRRIRVQAYERDNYTCQDCGCRCLNLTASKSDPMRRIQAHHVIPRRLGGSHSLENLVTLCLRCHAKRDAAHRDSFIR